MKQGSYHDVGQCISRDSERHLRFRVSFTLFGLNFPHDIYLDYDKKTTEVCISLGGGGGGVESLYPESWLPCSGGQNNSPKTEMKIPSPWSKLLELSCNFLIIF